MQQLDIFNKKESNFISIQNGEYCYIPNYFDKIKSDFYFSNLLSSISWKQEEIRMYGKTVKFPRLTSWYGDNSKQYTFSGITLTPNLWTKELLEIKSKIEPKCKAMFNSVLLNLYRNGKDSISWHTDAEKGLGKNPIIASVNFGVKRKFQMRHIETKEKIEIELKHGSLLILQGQLQHYWQHQIPKTKTVVEERISLTFRVIK